MNSDSNGHDPKGDSKNEFDASHSQREGSESSFGSSSVSVRFPGWLKAALLVGVIALASVGYLSAKFSPQSPGSSQAAPELDPEELAKRPTVQEFTLTDAEGGQKKLSELKGNVVLLSFWASWCAPCLVELPTFAELDKKFRDRGFQIVAVNVDEGDDGKNFAKDFWAKGQFKFPAYFDTQKSLAQQFEVDMLPSNFVIDREGRLVFSSFGSNDWASPQTHDFIEGLLQEGTADSADAAEMQTE